MLATYEPKTKEADAAVFFVSAMIVLTFPIGLLVVGLAALGLAINSEFTGSNLSLLVVWSLLVLAGYWQWFVIAPKVAAQIREKFKGVPNKSVRK